MAKEGIPFILLFLIPAVVLAVAGIWLAVIPCLALAAFMAFFFRDPERISPSDPDLVISPADGKVLIADPVEAGLPESPVQISIFLSPLDVHINRSPITGQITQFAYKQGAFHVASKAIASVENEQNIVTVNGEKFTILFRQIAGILARRLVFWKQVGDHVRMGEPIGLMKFSSRMDVILPPEIEVMVRVGDRVVGGITVIGRLRKLPGQSETSNG